MAGYTKISTIKVIRTRHRCEMFEKQSAGAIRAMLASVPDAARFAVGHWLGCPAGCYEGAGSGSTEDQAIRNCCFWGQRRPRAIATVKRGTTWFAVVLYE